MKHRAFLLASSLLLAGAHAAQRETGHYEQRPPEPKPLAPGCSNEISMVLPCECPNVLIEEYADTSRKDWFDKFQGLIAYDFVLKEKPEYRNEVVPDWAELSIQKSLEEAKWQPKQRLTKAADPTTKARKAARRRAKAGRKANR